MQCVIVLVLPSSLKANLYDFDEFCGEFCMPRWNKCSSHCLSAPLADWKSKSRVLWHFCRYKLIFRDKTEAARIIQLVPLKKKELCWTNSAAFLSGRDHLNSLKVCAMDGGTDEGIVSEVSRLPTWRKVVVASDATTLTELNGGRGWLQQQNQEEQKLRHM